MAGAHPVLAGKVDRIVQPGRERKGGACHNALKIRRRQAEKFAARIVHEAWRTFCTSRCDSTKGIQENR
jgi:hypothetical protein